MVRQIWISEFLCIRWRPPSGLLGSAVHSCPTCPTDQIELFSSLCSLCSVRQAALSMAISLSEIALGSAAVPFALGIVWWSQGRPFSHGGRTVGSHLKEPTARQPYDFFLTYTGFPQVNHGTGTSFSRAQEAAPANPRPAVALRDSPGPFLPLVLRLMNDRSRLNSSIDFAL